MAEGTVDVSTVPVLEQDPWEKATIGQSIFNSADEAYDYLISQGMDKGTADYLYSKGLMDPKHVKKTLGSVINNFVDNLLTGSRDDARDIRNQKFEAATNALEAQKERDYAERLSNTAYQRAAADAKAAGFNPALVMMQGGAYVPNGSAAHVTSHSSKKTSDDAARLIGNIFSAMGYLIGSIIRSS